MVSIIAKPTNRVRDSVPAASGWRAMASIAAATALPSASAGPMAPNDTAMAAHSRLIASMDMKLTSFDGAHGAADEHGGKNGEDVGLDQTGQEFERHQRDRHEQAGQRDDDGDHEFAAHDVAEQAHHQGEGAGDLRQQVERQHDD